MAPFEAKDGWYGEGGGNGPPLDPGAACCGRWCDGVQRAEPQRTQGGQRRYPAGLPCQESVARTGPSTLSAPPGSLRFPRLPESSMALAMWIEHRRTRRRHVGMAAGG